MRYLIRFKDGSSTDIEASNCFEASDKIRKSNPGVYIESVTPIILSPDDETYQGNEEE